MKTGGRTIMPWWVTLSFHAALLLSLCALVLDVATIAGNDYTRVLLLAIGCATASLGCVLVVCGKAPWPGRLLAGGIACVDLFVLWNAGAQRLLGL